MTLKILHILPSPHLGGAEHVCLSLIESHRARGLDVQLLVLAKGPVSDTAMARGIPTTTADLEAARARGKSAFRAAAAEQIKATVLSFKPDLVHSHVPITNLLCSRVLPTLRVPWVTTIHGSWKQFAYAPQTEKRPYLRPYLRLRHALGDYLTTRSAARVVAVSDYVRGDLIRVGLDPAKIVRIYNGFPALEHAVPSDIARGAFGLGSEDVVIGALGYFAPVKGFDLLIEAFARIAEKYPKAKLVIAGGDVIGDSSYRDRIQGIIKHHHLDERIQMPGAVDPRGGFMSALDIFVISSRTEGLPLALIDAMLHAKASIVSSAGGSSEAARPGQESLLFKSGNVGSLAASLEQLIQNPGEREALGRAAWARASTLLTLSRCADEYDDLYRSVCKTHL
jgi:glycosyltransferase involved in cell wall biosynthesis